MGKKKRVEDDCDLSTFEGCLKAMFKHPESAEDAAYIEAAFNQLYVKYRKSHVKQLIEAFNAEFDTTWNAYYLLELIASSGSKKAYPIFVAYLNHEYANLRRIAAGGLAYIGDKQSLDALRSAYDSYEFETEEETEAFRKMVAKKLWGD